MANLDSPKGLWPVRHLTGGEIRTNEYILTTAAVVYKGDILKVVAGGTVEAAAANDGIIVVGVAAEYKDGTTAGTTVLVWDDPNIVFGVQADTGTAPAATDVFQTANHVAGAGNATTKLSGHELDASDIGTGAQLKIIGKLGEVNNAWGEHVKLAVLLNEHLYSAAVAGV